MRQLSAILLIGALLGQQAALPHSHAGSGVVEPNGHDARPHIHVAHHNAHEIAGLGAACGDDAWCADGPVSAQLGRPFDKEQTGCHRSPCGDHDEDAVYLNVGSTMGIEQPSPKCFTLDGLHFVPADDASATKSIVHGAWGSPRYGPRVPIFLASTRLLV